jgi:hypothetical protein
MVYNTKDDDLSKNEAIDEGFLEYLTDVSTKKIPKTQKTSKISKLESTLRKKARELLEKTYHFSDSQIIDNPVLETDDVIYRPDMVVIDQTSKKYLVAIQYQILEKTNSTTKKQLKQYMNSFDIQYGIIVGEKEIDFFQKTIDSLVPIPNIPSKSRINKKRSPLTISQEISEIIAKNLTKILSNSGFNNLDSVVLSLQVILVKSYDELNYKNAYFKDSNNPLSPLEIFQKLWDEFQGDDDKFIRNNYFEHLSNDTAKQLFSFVREFSVVNSDLTSLFKALLENIPSELYGQTTTPHHLLDSMFELGKISKNRNSHVTITSSGDSILKLISYLSSKPRLSENDIKDFLKYNAIFGVESTQTYDILSLYVVLSNFPMRLYLGGILDETKFDSDILYDTIIVDGLVTRRLDKKEHDEFQGLDFHDVLLSQAIKALNENGRLVVLLPKTYLFQKKSFRHNLLDGCSVRTIIEFPIGSNYNNFNCALVVFEKSTIQKPIFMAQYGTAKRSFFNPYNQIEMEKIFSNYREFEKTGTLSDESDAGFLVTLQDLFMDWTASRKLPSLKEKISKIKHAESLNNIVSIISGNNLRIHDKREIPYILISDFDDLSQKQIIPTSPKFPQNLNLKFLTKEGDILLSRSGTIGKIGIITKENENQLVSNGIAILRITKKEIDPSHLKNELEKEIVQEQFHSFSQSTYNSYLNNEMIGRVLVNLPTVKEQKELGTKINKIDAKIKEHKNQISKLEEELKKIRDE